MFTFTTEGGIGEYEDINNNNNKCLTNFCYVQITLLIASHIVIIFNYLSNLLRSVLQMVLDTVLNHKKLSKIKVESKFLFITSAKKISNLFLDYMAE